MQSEKDLHGNGHAKIRNQLLNLKSFCSAGWHWLLTSLIIAIAAVVLVLSRDLAHAAEIGEFLAGFSSALAFLWLIVGLKSQASDLAMQREELALHRAALEKQAVELKRSSKFAGLAQIEAILDRSARRIIESEVGIKNASDITKLWMDGMIHWKEMLESLDANAVNSRYMQWLKIEAVARGYLSSVALALKLYMEHYVEAPFEQKESDAAFIYVYSSWMNNAPFLSEHSGSALMVANLVFLYGPGLQALQTAGMFSAAKAFGRGVFKEGALEKMRDELQQRGITIPAVVRD